MPIGLGGSDYFRTTPLVTRHNFRAPTLGPSAGGVWSVGLKTLSGAAASVRTATKKITALNGAKNWKKTTPANMGFGAATDFSIALWFLSSSTDTIVMLDNGNAATSKYVTIDLNGGAAGYIRCRIYDGSTLVTVPSATNTYNDGLWHLLVLTFDRDGNVSMYVDGVSAANAVSMAAIGDITPASQIFAIGSTAADGSMFVGSLGEIQVISGVILSSEQVGYIYSYGIPDSYPTGTVVAHYKWDSNGTDETGNNTLTAGGSATVTTGGTYNQYATYLSGGGIRLWGNYILYAAVEGVSSFSVILHFKPLCLKASAVNQLFMLLGGTNQYFLYDRSVSKFAFIYSTGGAYALYTPAVASDSELQVEQKLAASVDMNANVFQLFSKDVLVDGDYVAPAAWSFNGNIVIGYSTNTAPFDVYRFGLFAKGLSRNEVINIGNALEYAL